MDIPPNVESAQQPQRGMEEIEAKGPGGIGLRVRGYDILTLVVVVGLALMAYMLYDHKAQAQTSQAEVVASLNKIAESYQELSYLMSLSPQDREKLRLEMPDSLRRKVRNARD